jgi:hypothetical protein
LCRTQLAQEGKQGASEDDLEDDLEDDGGDAPAKPMRTTFELADTLFAEAELEDTDTVYLWLGVSPQPSHDPLLLCSRARRRT